MNSVLLARAAARRARFMRQLDSGAALLPAARVVLRSADSEFPFRQDSDFYYLTAFPEPDAVCVLAPRHEQPYVLFVRPKDHEAEIWSGRRCGVEAATTRYGAAAAYPIAEFESRLPELLRDVDTLHFALGRHPELDRCVLKLLEQHRRTRPRAGRGLVRIQDPGALLHEMRIVKDEYEIGRMRAAASATCAAHARVLREARPEMKEYELEALFEHEFRSRGAGGPAYGTIVGTGDNATILHYRENCDTLREGQLVLVDAGAEFDLYAADVTRTFPVSVGFTREQAAVYQVVLEAQKEAIETVRPGARFSEAHERALEVICEGLVDLGLLPGTALEARETGAYRAYYMHRTGHWLGLDVHDVGLYEVDGASRRLEPGMVVTVEPGIYIAADQESAPPAFRGMGVRIEDDVLVTAGGHEVLTAAAPKELHEIEALRSVPAGAS